MVPAALLPQAARGFAEDTPYAALARFATALSEGDSAAAVASFDTASPQFGALESAVRALTAQTEILCSIEVLQESASNADRVLDADWYLQMRTKGDGGPTERRRKRLSVTVRAVGGKWKIVSLSLPSVLAPINIP